MDKNNEFQSYLPNDPNCLPPSASYESQRTYRGRSRNDAGEYVPQVNCHAYACATYGTVGVRLVEESLEEESPSSHNGSCRHTRGGGWDDDPQSAGVAIRFSFAPGFRNSALGFRLVEVVENEEKLMSDDVNAWVAKAVLSIDKSLREFGEENLKKKGLHGAIDVEGMARDLIGLPPLEAGQRLEGLANLHGPGDRYSKAAYAVLTTLYSGYFDNDDDGWFSECRSACPSIDH